MSAMINDLTVDPANEFLKRTWLIRSYLNKSVIELSKQTAYSTRFYCIARHNSVGYRGRINDFRKSIETGLSEVQVFFVDYGAYLWVRLENIYPIVDKFIRDLPFQAIECSLGGIESTENGAKWTDEQGDKLWLITHDSDEVIYSEDFIKSIYLDVVSEIRGKYSVRLFKKMVASLIDLSHELVTLDCGVRLTSDEEKNIFTIVDHPTGPFGPIAKQFVVYFIQSNNEQKQIEFVRLLGSRLSMFCLMETNEMLSTGLIQTIGQSLFFIYNKPTVLIKLLKFITQFFLRNTRIIIRSYIFMKEFILNNGMNNLIFILNECGSIPHELKEIIFNFLEIAWELNVFRTKALEEEYLHSIWCFLLKESRRTQNGETRVVNLLEKIFIEIKFNKPLYSIKLEKIISRYQLIIGRNEISTNYLNYILKQF